MEEKLYTLSDLSRLSGNSRATWKNILKLQETSDYLVAKSLAMYTVFMPRVPDQELVEFAHKYVIEQRVKAGKTPKVNFKTK
jgi:hypothetical protein